jgi:hypothetical protein
MNITELTSEQLSSKAKKERLRGIGFVASGKIAGLLKKGDPYMMPTCHHETSIQNARTKKFFKASTPKEVVYGFDQFLVSVF